MKGERVFALSSLSDPLPGLYKISFTVKNRLLKLNGSNQSIPNKLGSNTNTFKEIKKSDDAINNGINRTTSKKL